MSLVGSLRGVQANPEPCNSNSITKVCALVDYKQHTMRCKRILSNSIKQGLKGFC